MNELMDFSDPHFLLSVHHLKQLPDEGPPEIAFAGRSNVGKSSLMNRLLNRKGLVKISGRPGKTQGLNYFLVGDSFYLVDLPGYGYAKVSKKMQQGWQHLITDYLEGRRTLKCVVVIMDLRHEAKTQDTQLITWLKQKGIQVLPVYTKADKLSGNEKMKNAKLLDAGHTIHSGERIIFSAKTGEGLEQLKESLERLVDN